MHTLLGVTMSEMLHWSSATLSEMLQWRHSCLKQAKQAKKAKQAKQGACSWVHGLPLHVVVGLAVRVRVGKVRGLPL